MTTPYTDSRRRVLTSYLALRREGVGPAVAMQTVLTQTHRILARGGLTARQQAELEWDRAHARRYLGTIDLRSRDHNNPLLRRTASYWSSGHLWDWDLFND